MVAKLIAEEGLLKGLTLSLEEGDQWIIGRDPDACQLLIEDPSVSRKHLICRSTPKGILLENLSTSNPSSVNNEELKEPRLLHNQDTVKIGNSIYRFYSEGEVPSFHKEDSEAEFENEEDQVSKFVDHKSVTENTLLPPSSSNLQKEEEASLEEQKEEEKGISEIKVKENSESIQEEPEKDINNNKPSENNMQMSSEKSEEQENQRKLAIEEEDQDSIYDDAFPESKDSLVEINFDLEETGRWLLKVVSGPNNGAEFSMSSSSNYLIGTDPNTCDVVFHDTSVSRQHARISISPEENENNIIIEDLKSRNGTLIDGEPITGKHPLNPNSLVSMGTTSFIVYDREGEMQTIISPLLPSIVKVLQKEEPKKEEVPIVDAIDLAKESATPVAETTGHKIEKNALAAFVVIGIIIGLFVIIGIGTTTLFKSEPIVVKEQVDPNIPLKQAIDLFPSLTYSYNKATGNLLLVGHLSTSADRNQLMYALRNLNFIRNIDDSGVVIDEGVWRELNQVLNNRWKGISIHSPSAGHFVITGYLKTRKESAALWDYITTNFPYLDLLEKRVLVEEDVLAAVNSELQKYGLKDITVQISNGEVSLLGKAPPAKFPELNTAIIDFKKIQGVRDVKNLVVEQAPELNMINISDKYEVTGFSHQGKLFRDNTNIVINGRILTKGDILDGMTIVNIGSNTIFLEKEGVKYRIDYNR